MASQWFYQVAGKQVGPVSGAELLDLAQRGAVKVDTMVRKAPDGDWVPAKKIKRLFLLVVPSGRQADNAAGVDGPLETLLASISSGQNHDAAAVDDKKATDEKTSVAVPSAIPRAGHKPSDSPSTKACPYCGEQILAVAIKCKHCGSDLAHGTQQILQTLHQQRAEQAKVRLQQAQNQMWNAKLQIVMGIIGLIFGLLLLGLGLGKW